MLDAHLLEVISSSHRVQIENRVNDKAASVMTLTNCQYLNINRNRTITSEIQATGKWFSWPILKLEISSSK